MLLWPCIALALAQTKRADSWQSLDLKGGMNSVVAFGNRLKTAQSWQHPQLMKQGERVYLRGLAGKEGGPLVANTVIAALPEGFRPPLSLCFPAVAHSRQLTHLVCVMAMTGNVVLRTAAASHFVAFDGISFDSTNAGWLSPAVAAGYELKTRTGFQPAQYKLQGKLVFMRGFFRKKAGQPSNNDVLGGIPKSSRPYANAGFVSVSLKDTAMHWLGVYAQPLLNLAIIQGTAGREVSVDTVCFSTLGEGDAAWKPLALSKGFTRGLLDWQAPQYSEGEGGLIYLRGMVGKQSGAIADGDVIAKLPVGSSPPAHLSYPAIAHTGTAVHRLDLLKDGTVNVARTAGTAYVILDGLRFFRGAGGIVAAAVPMASRRTSSLEGFLLVGLVGSAVAYIATHGKGAAPLRFTQGAGASYGSAGATEHDSFVTRTESSL